jgi:hypothetical protein
MYKTCLEGITAHASDRFKPIELGALSRTAASFCKAVFSVAVAKNASQDHRAPTSTAQEEALCQMHLFSAAILVAPLPLEAGM